MDRDLMHELAWQITGLPVPAQQDEADFASALHRVEAFLAEYRHVPDPKAGDAYEARLGSWLDAERAADEHGALSQKRRERIQQVVGPEWRAAG